MLTPKRCHQGCKRGECYHQSQPKTQLVKLKFVSRIEYFYSATGKGKLTCVVCDVHHCQLGREKEGARGAYLVRNSGSLTSLSRTSELYISYCHNSVSNDIFTPEPDMTDLRAALSI